MIDRIKPVFIGGCGRSGTTLLGSMLGSHSQCIVTPESQFKEDHPAIVRRMDVEDEQLARETLTQVSEHARFRIWSLPLEIEKGVESLSKSDSLMTWLVREYALSRGKTEASVWIDHTGSNAKNALRLLERFPDAKFIHIVRDGRGVAASVIPLDWGPNTVHFAAHWWTERLAYGLASEQCLQERAIRVSFEELVSRPAVTLMSLCDRLGLRYEPQMSEGGGFEVPEFTKGQHRLVGSTPDASRATGWETILSDREVEIFEYLTGDLLPALGYGLRYGAIAAPVRWRERVIAYGTEGVRGLIANRVRHHLRMRRSLFDPPPLRRGLAISETPTSW